MKTLLPLLLIGVVRADVQPELGVTFIRQQQAAGVVWDMPVKPGDGFPSAPDLTRSGTLYQLWSLGTTQAEESLVDQKLVGSYLPAAELRIKTLDPQGRVPRTRVDQPFTVEIGINGLISGAGLPRAATSVLLERHLASYPSGDAALEPSQVRANDPQGCGYISSNGRTVLRFPASSLAAPDPTKAFGEEHFVIHTLSDGSLPQTQIASGIVQVWPIASGAIHGICPGETLSGPIPDIGLELKDLYPRSESHLMLFKGTQFNGTPGTIVKSHLLDGETGESTRLHITGLGDLTATGGTYTLALVSDTVYGRELLCDAVTFHVSPAAPEPCLTKHP
jgi:hypothetical protein